MTYQNAIITSQPPTPASDAKIEAKQHLSAKETEPGRIQGGLQFVIEFFDIAGPVYAFV